MSGCNRTVQKDLPVHRVPRGPEARGLRVSLRVRGGSTHSRWGFSAIPTSDINTTNLWRICSTFSKGSLDTIIVQGKYHTSIKLHEYVRLMFRSNDYCKALLKIIQCVSSRSTPNMMRLIFCCLFGLLLTLASAVPPENCPPDHDPTCRTDHRYRVGHDWIPYANASSGDGIRWRVLVDQHDYQNIFGDLFFPPGKWKAVDVDGDGITVRTVAKLVVLGFYSCQCIINTVGPWKWRYVHLSSSDEFLQAAKLQQLVLYSSRFLL